LNLFGIDLVLLLATTVAAGTPVLLATLGAILNERSGVLNLGLEGLMLVGALAGFVSTNSTKSVWVGVVAALAAGAALALIHAFFTITLQVNQVVSGLALTLFGTGLTAYLGRPYIGIRTPDTFTPINIPLLADIPILGPILFKQDLLVYLSIGLTMALYFFIFKSRPGLQLRAVGESPATADSMGISVLRTRYIYVLAGGALVGLGGAYLTLASNPAWLENISAGKGWVAVALVIFAGWQPLRALLGAYLFGGVESFQFSLQAAGSDISSFFLKMLPYILTLAALIFVQWRYKVSGKHTNAPAALGVPYIRQEKS
jgi:simple sugar transport system permease protein